MRNHSIHNNDKRFFSSPKASSLVLWPTLVPIQYEAAGLPQGKKSLGVRLTTDLYLMPRLTISGLMPPRCVKKQLHLSLYIYMY
jgi:hypothetical protein